MSQTRKPKPSNVPDIMHSSVMFESDSNPSQSVWAGITAREAAFVRQALIRAQALRLIHADPGDAYLQGVADTIGFKHLQELELTFQTDFDERLKVELPSSPEAA